MTWISIDDGEFPKVGEDCLILFETGKVRRIMEDDLPAEIITHWCPFPMLSSQKENLSSYVRNGYEVYCLDDHNIAIYNDKSGFVVRRNRGIDYYILFKNCQPATRREYFDFISENKQP